MKTVQFDGKAIKKTDYFSLQPWGEGPTMCKGRKFAEGEVITIVAAIVTCWDITPIDGKWTHPGRKGAAAGAHKPVSDVRVRIERR